MTPTIAEQKQLIQKIKQLRCRKCYIEIFRCIVSTKTPYTQNKNGIFSTSQNWAPTPSPKSEKLFPNINPKPVQHLPLSPLPKKTIPFTILNPFSWENLGKIWCQKKLAQNKFPSFKTDRGALFETQGDTLRDSRLILGNPRQQLHEFQRHWFLAITV